MKQEVADALKQIDTAGWKQISLEYGPDRLEVAVPGDSFEVSMGRVPSIDDWRIEIDRAFSNPVGSPKLEEVIRAKGKSLGEMSAAIAVSDITRPVPYKGERGFLSPILQKLESAGIKKENIKIIVATGMHRPSSYKEKVEMFGEEIVDGYQILDHDCENKDLLVSIGKTMRGTDVYVNRDFYLSDVKISTGLVESHFMTGVSGGRKSICPGLVDVKTIQRFHGPQYLEDPNATNLVLEGNPCHEEALEVAKTVGVDFIVNVTLDKDMRVTKLFAGDLVEAHMEAYKMITDCAAIPLDRQFDIVLTHGGYVGRGSLSNSQSRGGCSSGCGGRRHHYHCC